MLKYVVKRLAFSGLVVVIVALLTFLIFFELPSGDPAVRAVGRTATPESVAAARHNLGLDRPLYIQFGLFAKGLVPWPDWFLNPKVYYSYVDYQPVRTAIFSRLPITAVLVAGAAVIWMAFGLGVGVVSALRPRSLLDRGSMLIALTCISAPVFWLAYIALYVFWFKLSWAPGSGLPPGESLFESIVRGRFILPWCVLACGFAAIYARFTRANMLDVMNEDFIRTARAKGISERQVVIRHALRVAIVPVITLFGLDLAFLLGGAIITETIFNLPGVGQYTFVALDTNNFPVLMGVTVFSTLFIVASALIVDLLYALLNPMIRYG